MQHEKDADPIPSGGQPCWLRVLYLGIPGVLHPSESAYRQAHGVSPWEHGHEPYEGVPVLERALAGWPHVHIVLTSREPCLQGMVPVLQALGDYVARRVIGSTYDHLTRYRRPGRPGQLLLSAAEYGTLTKAEVVRRHVEWMRPAAWVAVDAEDCGRGAERAGHIVVVDGCKGLQDPAAEDKLQTLMHANFGPALQPVSGEGRRPA